MIEIILITIFAIWIIIELIIRKIILNINRHFQWLIIKKDEKPVLSKTGLQKFFSHGYDSELGWDRKPNTSHEEIGKYGKTFWSIDEKGCRKNSFVETNKIKISCYGDSFTFGRQVNDDETWEYYLSELTNSNVLNFGVGNYGVDQALLKLKREFSKNPTELVILGVVPDTIQRILSVWKHYYEYGNTFGFKPRYKISKNELVVVKNYINTESKFKNYKNFLNEIKKEDYFYKNKFKKEIITFPYSINFLKNFKRNFGIILRVYKNKDALEIIMKRNLEWRIKLFNDNKSTNLLVKIIQEYVNFSKQVNFEPIFVFLPQKDDILFIKRNFNFYKDTVNEIRKIHDLIYIDILDELLEYENLNELYSENSEYGGHYSRLGNEIVAKIIFKKLNVKKL